MRVVDWVDLNIDGYKVQPYQEPSIPENVVVHKAIQFSYTQMQNELSPWNEYLNREIDNVVLTISTGKKRHYAPKKRKRRLRKKIAKMVRKFRGNFEYIVATGMEANVQFGYTEEVKNDR